MGYDLTLSGQGDDPPGEPRTTRICTSLGYKHVTKWMRSLPRGKYPAVDAVDAEGEFKPTDVLASQLNAAFFAHPPNVGEATGIVNGFLDLFGDGHPEETAAITNGG